MILALGLFMAIAPKYAVKKEFREDEAQIKSTRIKGIILAALAAGVEVLFFFIR